MKYIRIIATAGRSIFVNWKVLSKALCLPVLLYVSYYSFEFPEEGWWYKVIDIILHSLILALIAIPIHRVILLGPDSVSKWFYLTCSKREANYLFYLIVLFIYMSVIIVIPFMIFSSVVNDEFYLIVLLIIVTLISFWFLARLTLVLPAIAIDEKGSFKQSWKLTKNFQATLFFVVILPPVLVFTILYFYYSESLLFEISSIIISTSVEIFSIASLSIAYRMFSEEKAQSLPLTK